MDRSPILLGIVNITEDSFSDGGRYLATDAAISHAKKLYAAGAMIVDLGAAASNPKAKPIAAVDEIARLAPVVEALQQEKIAISIDTFSPAVQRWALGQDVDYLNDIHGFPDPTLYPALATGKARLIVMHAVQAEGRATPVETTAQEIMGRILHFFETRLTKLEQAGIARSRLILDPGMGFFLGKEPLVSFEVLRRLPDLKEAFGLPILISVSRKSFLRIMTKRSAAEAGPATLAAELFAVSQGADYIRTHDPAALSDGLAVWAAATTRNTV
ncbi:MAG: dihydropteroate synthase [Rhizomicrobium sp.]